MEAVKNSVLIIWVPGDELSDERVYRDYVLESLKAGVLILPSGFSCEVLELPPLGNVAALPPEESVLPEPIPEPETLKLPTEAEEKRMILQKLKDYRAANGLGSLEEVSARTAHLRQHRISSDTLRSICVGDIPTMPIENWQKIDRALNLLEQNNRKEENHVSEDHPV